MTGAPSYGREGQQAGETEQRPATIIRCAAPKQIATLPRQRLSRSAWREKIGIVSGTKVALKNGAPTEIFWPVVASSASG